MTKAKLLYLFLWLFTSVVVVLAASTPPGGAGSALGPSGRRELRKVDVDRVLRLMQEGKLSDKEAMFYRVLDASEGAKSNQ